MTSIKQQNLRGCSVGIDDAVEMGSGAMIYKPRSIKNGSGI
jgi:hypothetical protein